MAPEIPAPPPGTPPPEGAPPAIAFIDLGAQRRRLGARLDAALAAVLEHGQFIHGPEVARLEAALAAFTGAGHVVACANGTDALALGLMARGIGPGDAVIVPAFTFAATAEVVVWLGATPVFTDVDPDSMVMGAADLAAGIAAARRLGLRPAAAIPVDLFGLPADYAALMPLAAAEGVWVLADAAQSLGARRDGRAVGCWGALAATSFFPAKPLGCYGDGGALFTDDGDLAALLRSLRVHGQGADKYDNVRIGMNGRLDTLQAAILLEKLTIFPDEILARRRVAARYGAGLAGLPGLALPDVPAGADSVWAQYTLRVAGRDALAARLKAAGVPTAVYYPRPLNRQPAYARYPTVTGGALPVSEGLAASVLSLPMHPYLEPVAQDHVIAALRAALAG